MLLLAKVALGLGATMVMSTAYIFHDGVIRVDVDENRRDGSHIHFWVPATAVSAGLCIVPRHNLVRVADEARPFLPAMRQMVKELKKYPDADFVDVTDASDHLRISTVGGKIHLDAVTHDETVHLRIPIETLKDLSDHLEANAPTI
jgi:hypothetical protein